MAWQTRVPGIHIQVLWLARLMFMNETVCFQWRACAQVCHLLLPVRQSLPFLGNAAVGTVALSWVLAWSTGGGCPRGSSLYATFWVSLEAGVHHLIQECRDGPSSMTWSCAFYLHPWKNPIGQISSLVRSRAVCQW